MRPALLAVLALTACATPEQTQRARATVDQGAHVISVAAPMLVLIPEFGPACVVALRAACAAVETAAEWPDGPGATVVPVP